MATAAQNAIASHERVCEQRWAATMSTMRDIKGILAWGGGALFSAMLGLIGILATHPH